MTGPRRFIDRLPALATVAGIAVAALVVGAIATLAYSKGTSPPRELVGTYFPPGSISDTEQKWYALKLNTMREPRLGAPRANAANGVSELRVLVLPSFGPPAAVRYTFDTSGTQRRAMKVYRKDLCVDDTTTLAPAESAALLASLDASGYWSMPAEDVQRNEAGEVITVLGADGTNVVVETVRDGAHRVRVRWTPESNSTARGLDAFVAFYTDVMKRGNVVTSSGDVDVRCR